MVYDLQEPLSPPHMQRLQEVVGYQVYPVGWP